MSTENLSFTVTLRGTFWDKRPSFSIWLDDQVTVQSELPDQSPHTFTFSKEVATGDHSLQIRLENKDKFDTVIEDGNIVKDMLLNVDDITIDEISLGNLLWSAEYRLDNPQEYQGKTITHLDSCVNLGWNGSYILHFTSPYYLWLLEKL
jgi:hypothetical protein